jgi:hypothetical protein
MKNTLLLLGFIALTAASLNAAVIYSFSGITASAFAPVESVSFQYTAPDFIPENLPWPGITLTASQLDSCTDCTSTGTAIYFTPNDCGSYCNDAIFFLAANGPEYAFWFPVGAFDSPGTHSTVSDDQYSNFGTLTVTGSDTPTPGTPTPEPSTAVMTIVGILVASSCNTWRRARKL